MRSSFYTEKESQMFYLTSQTWPSLEMLQKMGG
jgi:hypothetical protein